MLSLSVCALAGLYLGLTLIPVNVPCEVKRYKNVRAQRIFTKTACHYDFRDYSSRLHTSALNIHRKRTVELGRIYANISIHHVTPR